jgi:hypothetical protein
MFGIGHRNICLLPAGHVERNQGIAEKVCVNRSADGFFNTGGVRRLI